MKHYQPDWSEQPEEWHEPKLESRLLPVRWLAVVITLVWIGAIVLFLTGLARAHDALPTAFMPKGWSYPISCCSGYDCREVDEAAIDESGPGYTIVATGEFIPQTDAKIKNSPDGKFHWCSKDGSDTGATICLFVPPRGF